MDNTGLTGAIVLSIPAQASMMLVARLTTAGAIARAGLTIDRMDSLKMAVEEACNCLMTQQNPPQTIGLRFESVQKQLCIRVAAENDCASDSMDETELEIAQCILSALADDVSFDVCSGRIRAIELRAMLE